MKMIANKNYESDIQYTLELNRFICRLLGIWPHIETKPSFSENMRNNLLILMCFCLLWSELIPTVLHMLMIEKRTNYKLKLLPSVTFTVLALFKYCSLVFSRNQVRNCLLKVQEDWRNANANTRDYMIEGARTSRRLLVLCSIFMYSSGLYFRTVLPLSKGKFVTDQNITMRYLPCPSYFVFFDGRISPAYEILFLVQFLSGFIKYTITVAICSLAALFTMHICAQMEILMALMDSLVSEREGKYWNVKLAVTVEYQIRLKYFLQLVQDTLEHTSLLELMGCTVIVCLLLHDAITEWRDQNVVAMCSYLILLTSIGFNIFIFCFIGEQLSIEGEKLSLTTCTFTWYRLPDVKARTLILIIAMSNIPIKLRAGKFIDLSIRTFGDVVKTALTYFNLLRTVVD